MATSSSSSFFGAKPLEALGEAIQKRKFRGEEKRREKKRSEEKTRDEMRRDEKRREEKRREEQTGEGNGKQLAARSRVAFAAENIEQERSQ